MMRYRNYCSVRPREVDAARPENLSLEEQPAAATVYISDLEDELLAVLAQREEACDFIATLIGRALR